MIHNSFLYLLTGLLVAILSSFSLAQEKPATPNAPDASYYMCKNGMEIRTIRVEKKGSACRAYYTKEGVDKEVGKSNTSEVCMKVINRIKINLEAGEWKCRDISQSRVSSSQDQ